MMGFLKGLLLGQRAGDGHDLDPHAAVRLMDGGAPVVDVREPGEFASGAIPGSVNVPLGQVQARGIEALKAAGIDVDAPALVVVCRSGARSGRACLALRGALGERARNLAGGVVAWGSRGLPLTPGGTPTA